MKINELLKTHAQSLIFFSVQSFFNFFRIEMCFSSFNFQVFEERPPFYLLIQTRILCKKEKKKKHFKIRYQRTSLKSETACKTALGNSLVILFRGTFFFFGWFASRHRSVISLDTKVILLFSPQFIIAHSKQSCVVLVVVFVVWPYHMALWDLISLTRD